MLDATTGIQTTSVFPVMTSAEEAAVSKAASAFAGSALDTALTTFMLAQGLPVLSTAARNRLASAMLYQVWGQRPALPGS